MDKYAEIRTKDAYRDGGTIVYTFLSGARVYIDNRIRSETKGELFVQYPGDTDAKPVTDPELLETILDAIHHYENEKLRELHGRSQRIGRILGKYRE